MDTFTHAIVGAALARATAGKADDENTLPIKVRVWVGGLAAAFPDIDFITAFINPLRYISDWHRAETHSLVMLPLWSLLLGYLVSIVVKRPQHWPGLALICGIGILSHIVTDLITSWGTAIFAPLSNYRPSWGITFIIDPYFTLIVLTGLAFALLKNSRWIAQAAVVLLITYVGFQALLKFQAHSIAEHYVIEHRLQSARVDALPQPFSPFYWKLIVDIGDSYRVAFLDLIGSEHKPLPTKQPATLLRSVYYYRPRQQLVWSRYSHYGVGDDRVLAKQIWLQPQLKHYRQFAAYPALYRIDATARNHCVWFMDLRFLIPQLKAPFRYGLCGTSDNWRLYRLSGGDKNEKQLID